MSLRSNSPWSAAGQVETSRLRKAVGWARNRSPQRPRFLPGQVRIARTDLQGKPPLPVHPLQGAGEPHRTHAADHCGCPDAVPEPVQASKRIRSTARDADHAELIDLQGGRHILDVRYGLERACLRRQIETCPPPVGSRQ